MFLLLNQPSNNTLGVPTRRSRVLCQGIISPFVFPKAPGRHFPRPAAPAAPGDAHVRAGETGDPSNSSPRSSHGPSHRTDPGGRKVHHLGNGYSTSPARRLYPPVHRSKYGLCHLLLQICVWRFPAQHQPSKNFKQSSEPTNQTKSPSSLIKKVMII